MRRVFADTSYFIALVQPNDEAHPIALRHAQISDHRLVTSEGVICEVANFLSKPEMRVLFEGLIGEIHQSSDVVVASHDWFERGLALYRQRRDKSWSLTNCISFRIMQMQGIAEALTADHHFEQAGFTVLLK